MRSAPRTAVPGGAASGSSPRSATSPASAGTAEPGSESVAARVRSNVTTRAIALVAVLLVLVISYASSLRIYFAQTSEIAATRAEIADRQQRISDLQVERGRWDDSDHVMTQARERLGWVVPGETGYQVVGPDGEPLGGGAAIEAAGGGPEVDADVWWAELWGSVETADQPPPPKKKDTPITTKTKPSTAPR